MIALLYAIMPYNFTELSLSGSLYREVCGMSKCDYNWIKVAISARTFWNSLRQQKTAKSCHQINSITRFNSFNFITDFSIEMCHHTLLKSMVLMLESTQWLFPKIVLFILSGQRHFPMFEFDLGKALIYQSFDELDSWDMSWQDIINEIVIFVLEYYMNITTGSCWNQSDANEKNK